MIRIVASDSLIQQLQTWRSRGERCGADPESFSQVKRLPEQQASMYQLKWLSLFGRCHLFMSGGGEVWSNGRLGFKVWHGWQFRVVQEEELQNVNFRCCISRWITLSEAIFTTLTSDVPELVALSHFVNSWKSWWHSAQQSPLSWVHCRATKRENWSDWCWEPRKPQSAEEQHDTGKQRHFFHCSLWEPVCSHL